MQSQIANSKPQSDAPRGVRVIKQSLEAFGETDIERRIYRAIEDPSATFDDLKQLYREARSSEFATYVKIDWGTMAILIRTRWTGAMAELIG